MIPPNATDDPDAVAAAATTHAFLNSYLRETGNYEVVEDASAESGNAIRFELSAVGVEVGRSAFVPVGDRSPPVRPAGAVPRGRRVDDARLRRR